MLGSNRSTNEGRELRAALECPKLRCRRQWLVSMTLEPLHKLEIDDDVPRPDTGRCGTESGYQWHRRHKEEPCRACKLARATAVDKRKHDRRLADRGAPDHPHRWTSVNTNYYADAP